MLLSRRFKENINYLLFFLFLVVQSCAEETYTSTRVTSETTTIDQNILESQNLSTAIAPFKSRIDQEMDSVLAYASRTLTKKDTPYNTAIGNMMADAVFELANPVFQKRTNYPFHAVLLNHGGIRSSLNKSNITTKTAYTIMPFENDIVVVELSGKHVKDMFNYLESGVAHPIAGMTIELDQNGKLKDARIQGWEIKDDETYFIATTDYLQNGGDRMDFFSKPISILSLNYKMRNVLIDYFKKNDTIAPVNDQRFFKSNS